MKDEGRNPTGTFKDRGAACGIARAAELGVREVALPTAGNAGTSWSAYGAAAGLRVHVAMPGDAPEANRLACELFGAEVVAVDGLISDAAAVIADGVAAEGWFDAGTLHEPYRIEGKKTLGLEIAEQLEWRLPDAIVYPAGGGVGIIGIWRGLEQLRELGWVDGPLPRLIVVQAEGARRWFGRSRRGPRSRRSGPGPGRSPPGFGSPRRSATGWCSGRSGKRAGRPSRSPTRRSPAAMRVLAEDEGLFASPEGAATVRGGRRASAKGRAARGGPGGPGQHRLGGGLPGRGAVGARAGHPEPGRDVVSELPPFRGRSWWLRQALAADPGEPCPPPNGDAAADVVILGGGYTGLWTAWFLTERDPGLSVVVLEQDVCGGGPSGRNGGFVTGWWDDLPDLAGLYGIEGAFAAAREVSESVRAIGTWCQEQEVDAHYRRAGYLTVATAPAQDDAWTGAVELCRRLGGRRPTSPCRPRRSPPDSRALWSGAAC